MEKIVEIEKVEIDSSLPKEEKIEEFVKEIRNPYRFKVGDIIVNVAFDENGLTLHDKMLQYFRLIMA